MARGNRRRSNEEESTSTSDGRVVSLLESMETRLNGIDMKLNKLESIDVKLGVVEAKYNELKPVVDSNQAAVKFLQVQTDSLKAKHEELDGVLSEVRKTQILSDYNSRQYNILIRNMTEFEAKEDMKKTLEYVRMVLNNVLKVPDANNIVIRDCHRLPSSKGRRPIIFKLNSMFDKQRIWNCIFKLQEYNEGQDDNNKLYIEMNHLPSKLQNDKKSLLNDFRTARNEGKVTKWFFDKKSAEYCLKIDHRVVKPKCNIVGSSFVVPQNEE